MVMIKTIMLMKKSLSLRSLNTPGITSYAVI